MSSSNGQGYTEEQRAAFLERALEIGVKPAMQDLGYPGSTRTAFHWCDQYGVRPNVHSLQQHANEMRQVHGLQEKLALCNTILDRAFDIAQRGFQEPLTTLELNRLSLAVERAIKTIELLEGRSTERVETVDSTDLELIELINEQKAKNQAELEELTGD